ncbi:MAG TPA: hypothetical protein VM345_14710 [Acidimicrobiales bacterium]|jgi:hypothetical protein|nr:hypothetical protein [Acidimicrobiales bacterium]
MRTEQDLYPPDLEVVTPEARSARDRAMFGTFLVAIGTGLMLERTFNNDLDVFMLAVGLSLIVGWLQAPRFGMFAVGSIVTGFGAASFFSSLVSIPFEATIGNLFAAVGFAAVYVRYPHRAKWALIPAGISLLVAVASAGVSIIGLIPSAVTSLLLPLLLIGAGGLLLMRHALPPRIVKGGLVAIAVLFLASAMSSVGDWDGPNIRAGSGAAAHDFTAPLPDLDGRLLVLQAGDAAVLISTVDDDDDASVTATTRGLPGGAIVVDDGSEIVRVSLTGPHPLATGATSWELHVPEDANLRVTTTSGPIRSKFSGGDVTLRSASGPIVVEVEDDDGSLELFSASGPIHVDAGGESPKVVASSTSGQVIVDGRPRGTAAQLDGSGPAITVTSTSGPVVVTNLDDAA